MKKVVLRNDQVIGGKFVESGSTIYVKERLYTNKELGDSNRDKDDDDSTHGGVKTLKLSSLPSKDNPDYMKTKKEKEKLWKDKGYSGVRWE